ncbi:hypothetical protein HK103_003813 [Boothiomyces macroporosus]|uniref:Uncharacterized protein n=1 Tax=Boothiomyces macroporosus TaxID=261099 RepID=A0AAD5Y6A8_9FUNG|nr:hypothetical protein HK103_003813 [Boothiomyces macroporosus]
MFAKSNTGRLSNNSSIPVPKKKSFTKTKPVPEDRTNRDKLILVDRKPALADRTPVLADRTSVLVDRTNKQPNVDTINKEPNVDKATPFKKVSFTDIPDFTFSTPRRKELNLGTPIRIPKTPQNKPVVNITPKINNKVALQLGKILMDNE